MLGYVLEDLPTLPEQPAVLVVGPQVVPDLLPADARAVFLIPTPEFQRANLSARPMPSSDPAQALANRLVKDRLYADRVAELAHERGYIVISVDGTRPPEEIRAQVEEEFRAFLAASEPVDISGVRRWENQKIARNVRAWSASGDHRTSAEMKIPFACECGRLGCCERARLSLAEFDAQTQVVAHP